MSKLPTELSETVPARPSKFPGGKKLSVQPGHKGSYCEQLEFDPNFRQFPRFCLIFFDGPLLTCPYFNLQIFDSRQSMALAPRSADRCLAGVVLWLGLLRRSAPHFVQAWVGFRCGTNVEKYARLFQSIQMDLIHYFFLFDRPDLARWLRIVALWY